MPIFPFPTIPEGPPLPASREVGCARSRRSQAIGAATFRRVKVLVPGSEVGVVPGKGVTFHLGKGEKFKAYVRDKSQLVEQVYPKD